MRVFCYLFVTHQNVSGHIPLPLNELKIFTVVKIKETKTFIHVKCDKNGITWRSRHHSSWSWVYIVFRSFKTLVASVNSSELPSNSFRYFSAHNLISFTCNLCIYLKSPFYKYRIIIQLTAIRMPMKLYLHLPILHYNLLCSTKIPILNIPMLAYKPND